MALLAIAPTVGAPNRKLPANSFRRRIVRCCAGQSLTVSHISDPNYVRILDATLRGGEQSPSAAMIRKAKLYVAMQLSRLGVDIIEAGFPIASKHDFEAVRSIARVVGNAVTDDGYVPVICGLARCNRPDIEASWDAVHHALRPRVHVFIATSDIHLKHKLKKTSEEVVDIARNMVAFARSLGCEDVQFSPQDAGRSDREFLYLLLGEVIKAGATTLNIPDTVGNNLPNEFGKLISDIKSNTPGIENVIISAHCKNYRGLATANTLAGAYAGARQLEVSINGIGGHASLEEVIMTLRCRGKEQLGGLYTRIDTGHITKASNMVTRFSGLLEQPHKAIVGDNAFAHKNGINQHLNEEDKDALVSDEIFQPQTIWTVENVEGSSQAPGSSTATVELVGPDGATHVASAVAKDPVRAAYEAIDSIVQVPVTVTHFSVNSVTAGSDAIAHSRVVIRMKNPTTPALFRTFSGSGADSDLVVSSIRAYMSALNQVLCIIQQGK